MPKITIKNTQDKETILECGKGENLYRFLAAQHLMDAPCGGLGTCGKCKIKLIKSTFEIASGEAQFFSEQELAEGWRLACLHQVKDDVILELPPEEVVSEIACKGYLRPFKQNPRVVKTLDKNGDTLVLATGDLLCKEDGDTRDKQFGIAIDIGTTTVVASLVDLQDGKELLSMSCLNGQKAFGQDVITRINYAMTQPKGTLILQKTILKDLAHLIQGILKSAPRELSVGEGDIYEIIIGANTTMVHLLAGIDPSAMGKAPYVPGFEGALTLQAKDLGLPVSEVCQVYCIPAVSAFVGGDITAGILSCGVNQAKKAVLFIDIGTNGEMVLSKEGKMYACSCAAGPALEGMNISCGVRAAKGAIEDVIISQENDQTKVEISVIGREKPTGLCGSGLLAAIAELNRAGIIHKSGRFLDHPLVEKVDGKKRFIIDKEHQIYLTQQDVRQVQLAKGAILSGIQAMLLANQMTESDIQEVVVAGQFGAHLKAESLTGAGLIPQGLEQAITYVGNTSKAGAYLCLLSVEDRKMADTIVQDIDYIELSRLAGYDDLFVKAMEFSPVV